jgi:hypothetical protein
MIPVAIFSKSMCLRGKLLCHGLCANSSWGRRFRGVWERAFSRSNPLRGCFSASEHRVPYERSLGWRTESLGLLCQAAPQGILNRCFAAVYRETDQIFLY